MSNTAEKGKAGYEEQLFEAVMCGIVHYSLGEHPRVLRFNGACAQIYGYDSREEFQLEVAEEPLRMVYSYDEEFLKGFLRRAIHTGQTVNFGHRILRKNQTIGYIMGTLRVISLEDGSKVIQSIFQDSGQHIMQADIRKSIYYQSIEASLNTRKIILADTNQNSRRKLREALQDSYTVIEVESAGEVLSVLKKEEEEVTAVLIAATILVDQDYRFIAALRGSILYATIPLIALADLDMTMEEILSYGVNEAVYPPYDANVIRMRLNSLIELRDTAVQRNTIEALMNNLSGGVLVCRNRKGDFAPLYFTDGVPMLSGRSKREIESVINRGDWKSVVYDRDLERVEANIRKAVENGDPIEVTFRVYHKNSSLQWVHMHGTQIHMAHEDGSYQCILSPTSSSERTYMDIMNDSFNAIIVYGEHKDDLLYFNNAAVPLLGENLLDVFAGEALSETAYVQKQILLADSRQHITLNGKIIDWNGIKAKIIYATDDTDSYRVQMERHQLYEVEMSRQENLSENVILSAIFNVNRDELLELGTDSLLGLAVDRPYAIAECVEKLCGHLACEKRAAEFRKHYGARAFLEGYQSGKTKYASQCRIRRGDGGFRWITVSWSLVENPVTLELYAFLYVYDVDWDVIREKSFTKILGFEEEYVACLDLASQNIRLMELTDEAAIIDRGQMSYEDFHRQFWKDYVSEREWARLMEWTNIGHIREQLAQDPVYHYYYKTKKIDGRRRYKKVRVFYLDDNRDIICFTRTDVTDFQEEQQRQNEQLAAALAEAEQASKAKSMFLSRISHDIRTPMNAILGMSRLALDRIDEKTAVHDYLEKVQASGSYLLGLINDILDMSRIESDRVQLKPEPYSIRACVDFVLVTLRMQMDEKRLHFEYVESEPMPEYVMLDKMRIQQVFFNLLSNAVKFAGEDGHVRVEVIPGEYQDGKLSASVRVIDDGIGIAKEDQKRIFEPFEQGANQNTTRQSGSGLGLAIVRNLIQLMGGSISLESEPGRGTTFEIQLKLDLVEDAGGSAEDPDRRKTKQYDFRDVSVLLTEDNAINMEIARDVLEMKHCRVTEAVNGQEALDILKASEPGTFQAVFMDVRMPVMDGLEATRQIRGLGREDLLAIPIIAMTASAFEEDKIAIRKAGMNAYLSKPINVELLYETLHEMLAEKMKEDRNDGQ